jgi:hypothetical protein
MTGFFCFADAMKKTFAEEENQHIDALFKKKLAKEAAFRKLLTNRLRMDYKKFLGCDLDYSAENIRISGNSGA